MDRDEQFDADTNKYCLALWVCENNVIQVITNWRSLQLEEVKRQGRRYHEITMQSEYLGFNSQLIALKLGQNTLIFFLTLLPSLSDFAAKLKSLDFCVKMGTVMIQYME